MTFTFTSLRCRAPKILGISKAIRVIKVSFIVSMRYLWKGWGMVARRSNHWLEDWDFQSQPPMSGDWRGDGGWMECQWPVIESNRSHLCKGTFIKIRKVEVWRASTLVNLWRLGNAGQFWGIMEAVSPFITPYSIHLLHLAASELLPFVGSK